MSKYPEIIIIVGSGRSGTSYLQRTLRDTLDIGFFREPRFVIPIYRKLHRFGDLSVEENLRKLVRYILADEIFERLSLVKNISSIFDEIFPLIDEPTYSGVLYTIFEFVAKKQGKDRLGYKFPSDINNMPALAEIFPTARFVHMLRDGRDVSISLLRQKWGPVNLYAGSRYWAIRTERGRTARQFLADRYVETRFEDLILNTEKTASVLGEFLNRGENIKQVDSLIELVNKSKKTTAVYNWKTKLTDDEIYVCESAASTVLNACGYPLKFSGTAKIQPLMAWYYLSSDIALRAYRKWKQ